MFTDPEKLRMGDPGHPEICPVYALHKIYTGEGLEKIAETCRSGELGCVADKKHLTESINDALAPVRSKRAELVGHPDVVWDVLNDGAKRARDRAQETMDMVRSAMGLTYDS
jgi:tryptophanyl-tRNA synthetase